jgi:hypothetical protein
MTADKKRSRSPALSSKLPELLPKISLRHGQAIWLLTELGGVKVTAARRHAARPPSRERRTTPRERANRPWRQTVSDCRLAS